MKKVVMLIAVLTMSLGSLAAAEEWDLNTDMNATTNEPNGIWTYCYGLGDPNNPDPNAIPTYKGLMEPYEPVPGLWIKIWYPVPVNVTNWHPHIWKDGMGVPTGWHGMKPGWRYFADAPDAPNRQAPAVIRWTAPAYFATPGTIGMNAFFNPTTDGTVEVYVVKSVGGDPLQQTVLLDEKDVTLSNPLEFGTTCEIAEGDTIDFMVGPQGPQDATTWNNTDWVGISIIISDEDLPPSCPNKLPMDFNEDCYVNLADFAVFAQSWLDCNNLNDDSCK